MRKKKEEKTNLIENKKDTFEIEVKVVLHLLCPKPIYSLGTQKKMLSVRKRERERDLSISHNLLLQWSNCIHNINKEKKRHKFD